MATATGNGLYLIDDSGERNDIIKNPSSVNPFEGLRCFLTWFTLKTPNRVLRRRFGNRL